MAIPEKQLDTWTALGSVKQSAATYNTIKAVLEDKNAPYSGQDFKVFLQGSYGNDTNVYADSDVDIVIRLDEVYYSDLDNLTEPAKASYEKARVPGPYDLSHFKPDVLKWLQSPKNYGAAAKDGKKAIFVAGNGTRRDADVLVCAVLRRWWKESNGVDNSYAEGICFFLPDGTRVENFPEQHAANCTTKHQNTGDMFKPVVRIYKNMRNRMIDDGVIKAGLAPSYYIEGMLWNVPDDEFKTATWGDAFVKTFNWILNANNDKLLCANEMFYLTRPNSHHCWPTANFDAYIAAAAEYWKAWE